MKKIALINDLSGFGKCSLTAALPVLSVLGLQCHPIPTMVLSGQSGYSISAKKDLTEILSDYTMAWNAYQVNFDGIYTGYMASHEQINHILEFIKLFYKENTFLLVDPVMGDNGRPYSMYSDDLLKNMKELVKHANLITPNLTEACFLSDTDFDEIISLSSNDAILEKVSSIAYILRKLSHHNQDVVITGVKIFEENEWIVYNLALTEHGISLHPSKYFDKSFSGTGDLLSSVLCGLKMNGYSTEEALDIAKDFIYSSVSDAIEHNVEANEGVMFEKHLKELILHAK